MLTIYRFAMWLYPSGYRAEFADEMLQVLGQRLADGGGGMFSKIDRHGRELAGLLAGAVDERLRFRASFYLGLPMTWRRLTMRSSFRFPKSVAPMMLLVFAAVLFTIARAASTAVAVTATHVPSAGEKLSLPLSVGLWLGLAYLAGAIVWVMIHILHRSGSQRLSDTLTWPQK